MALQNLKWALAVLEAIDEDGPELAMAEISEHVNLDQISTNRLVEMLRSGRFIEKNEQTGRYRIGTRILELALSALNQMDMRVLTRPRLRDLAEKFDETAHLGILDGPEIIHLSCMAEAKRSLRSSDGTGTRAPAHCSSLGKSIFAFMPPSEVNAFLRKNNLAPYTGHTITDPALFLEEIERTRRRGYAIDDQEVEEGLRCIGAPILNGLNEVVASVSLSGPVIRVTDDRIPVLASGVVQTSSLISSSLGYRGTLPGG